MLSEDSARHFAKHWADAWNTHDLDQILSHYHPEVVLISPIAAKLLDDPSGTVVGIEALSAYFRRGLEAYPDLHFEILEVTWGLASLVLHYVNQKGIRAGELMELDADGKVRRVVAHYNG